VPARISVPVSDAADVAELHRIQARTHLSMAVLTRLLLHRGIRAYLTDRKVED
jgi:hypothetical protein